MNAWGTVVGTLDVWQAGVHQGQLYLRGAAKRVDVIRTDSPAMAAALWAARGQEVQLTGSWHQDPAQPTNPHASEFRVTGWTFMRADQAFASAADIPSSEGNPRGWAAELERRRVAELGQDVEARVAQETAASNVPLSQSRLNEIAAEAAYWSDLEKRRREAENMPPQLGPSTSSNGNTGPVLAAAAVPDFTLSYGSRPVSPLLVVAAVLALIVLVR